MSTRVCFDGQHLEFRGTGGRVEERPVNSADLKKLVGWASRYEAGLRSRAPAPLAELGRELYEWLDGSGHWLQALHKGSGPRELTLEVSGDPGEAERYLLDVPWELLADEQGFLSAHEARPLVLCRRLGEMGRVADPAHADLLLMFMAAAPYGEKVLDYEFEESGILQATDRLPLYLRVEESGCLAFLEDRIALEAPIEALHLSCHGTIEDGSPKLILEDRFGERQDARSDELVLALGERPPLLVFLSACRTAEQPRTALPLALTLAQAGVANVLGWDGSVYDADASAFARVFYRELARRRTIGYAAAIARQELLRTHLNDPEKGQHWHLARVYLGGPGGGTVCANGKPLRRLERQVGYREFLDKERERVPVASALSFVGRRRETQAIVRAFEQSDCAGVLIHGMGRLGKSSLAARIANRMPGHKTAVVFQDYRAKVVLEEVLRALPASTAKDLRETWAGAVDENQEALYDALRTVLEGPCALKDAASGSRPILLVIDDLEQILETPAPGEAVVAIQAPYLPVLRSIVEAFADAGTASRLLLTSRYRFTLADRRGHDLAERLESVHLPPMTEGEQVKQLRAESALQDEAERLRKGDQEALAELLARCIAAAKGNPGLQTRLTTAALTEPDAAKAAVSAVENFHQTGAIPSGADIGEFFDQLTLGVYRGALTGDETALVRAALLFELPVPEPVMLRAGEAAGVENPAPKLVRLQGLGIIDKFVPEGRNAEPALLVNALARPLFERLVEADQRHLAQAVVELLADAWRDPDGALPYGPPALELVRLAELADDDPELLGEAALVAGRWLFDAQHNAAAAHDGRRTSSRGP